MGYDLSQTPVLVAQLAALADDRQFLLDAAATFWRSTPGRYPAAASLAPVGSEQAHMVAYRLLYRRRVFAGCMVVSLPNVPIAELLLAQDALFQQQTYDQRNPVTQYTPGGAGVKAGP